MSELLHEPSASRTHATHVSGWFPAVYMNCISQNFRLLHVWNLSVLNFRFFLLMYPGYCFVSSGGACHHHHHILSNSSTVNMAISVAASQIGKQAGITIIHIHTSHSYALHQQQRGRPAGRPRNVYWETGSGPPQQTHGR